MEHVALVFTKHKHNSDTNPEMRTRLYEHAVKVMPKGWKYVESYVKGRLIFDILNHEGKCIIHTRRDGTIRTFINGLLHGFAYPGVPEKMAAFPPRKFETQKKKPRETDPNDPFDI